uniref:Uncharacterized protein n=1 Tax=Avena sativa TaxID=4498 RepID=A0ACD5XQB7_AVESA
MKIDPLEHVIALDNAIGKTKLFHIGMKVDSTSRFPISYFIKKSFSVDNAQMLPSIKASPGQELISNPSPNPTIKSSNDSTPQDLQNTTPPSHESIVITTDKNKLNNSTAKRTIQFTEDETPNKESSKDEDLTAGGLELHTHTNKRPKQDITDNKVAPSI